MTPTVFIVDDEEAIRNSLSRLLGAIGVSTETYASGLDFLSKYAGERPGCLIADVRMPGMSGLDLMLELRRRHIEIPVILMTGHTDEQSIQRLEAERPFGFLEKPFSIKDLRSLVERWRATLT